MPEPHEQPMKSENETLNEQMVQTYLTQRKWMGRLALFFPAFFLIWTWIICRQFTPGPSISGYYHCPEPFVRDIFVGVLCIEGVLLALYRGYNFLEDWLFNLAGFCAVGIALFPTDPGQRPCVESPVKTAESSETPQTDDSAPADTNNQPAGKFSLHGFFAISFFVLIAISVITQAYQSLPMIADDRKRKWYKMVYSFYIVGMVAVPLVAWAILTLKGASYVVFAVEFFAIWIFAFYWRTKSKEFRETTGEPELELVKQRWCAASKR